MTTVQNKGTVPCYSYPVDKCSLITVGIFREICLPLPIVPNMPKLSRGNKTMMWCAMIINAISMLEVVS